MKLPRRTFLHLAAGLQPYLSGHSPPIFVQLPKADRFRGRLEAISRKFPLAAPPL